MSKVSVVTVTYNSSGNLSNFLDGIVKNLDFINEVIIIDNNSHDQVKTQNICNIYREKLCLRFIQSENNGFGKSSNLGVKYASSDHILLLNPDTELKRNSLHILTSHMKEGSADIIGGKAIGDNGRVHGSVVRIPTFLTGIFEFSSLGKIFNIHKFHKEFYYKDENILESDNDLKVNVVSGSYLLIKKKAFKKLNGFDEKFFMYLEDVDLGKRAHDFKMNVMFCPHSSIYHIGGASSDNKYKINHQAWFDSRKYYFKKHFSFIVNLIIQPAYWIEEHLLKLIKSL